MAPPMSPSHARVIDPVLSTFARGYGVPEMIAPMLSPAVPVTLRGGTIIVFDDMIFDEYDSLRTPGASTKRMEPAYGSETYALENHSLEALVPDENREDAAESIPGVDLAQISIGMARTAQALKLEIAVANLLTDPARYPDGLKDNPLSGNDLWSSNNSKPLQWIRDRKELVRARIGRKPNTLSMGSVTFQKLVEHPTVIERFKYTSRDSITPEMIGALLMFDQVLVGEAIKKVNGLKTDVWGDFALINYCPMQQGSVALTQFQPAHSYTYVLRGHPAVKEPYRDENRESWVYGVKYERQPVITGEGGYLIQKPANGA